MSASTRWVRQESTAPECSRGWVTRGRRRGAAGGACCGRVPFVIAPARARKGRRQAAGQQAASVVRQAQAQAEMGRTNDGELRDVALEQRDGHGEGRSKMVTDGGQLGGSNDAETAKTSGPWSKPEGRKGRSTPPPDDLTHPGCHSHVK